MRTCLVVFSEPGHVFEGIHRTIDGATASAASLGAIRMPDGREITADAVAALMHAGSTVTFPCGEQDEAEAVSIERHAILI